MRLKDGFFLQFLKLAGPFWNSQNRFAIRKDTVFLVILTLLQIYIAVVITQWNANLFDALEQRSMSGLFTQFGMLIAIFIANIAITTEHLLVKRRLIVGWRIWLTHEVVSKWLSNGKHHKMTQIAHADHENPDGRIAEDIRIATEDAIGLVHSLFYSVLLLGSFTTILWKLSGTINVNLGAISFSISGYLVWIAIVYATCASLLGWWMGKPLTEATHVRQTQEAKYRYALIKTQENAHIIARNNDETNEIKRLLTAFQSIIDTFHQQTAAWKQIQRFSSAYSTVSMALPIMTVAPRYIAGSVTLGALMQSIQAFEQMVSALSWPVNNIAQIAKWRTSVERVLGLVNAIDDLELNQVQLTRPKFGEITTLLPNFASALYGDLSILSSSEMSLSYPDIPQKNYIRRHTLRPVDVLKIFIRSPTSWFNYQLLLFKNSQVCLLTASSYLPTGPPGGPSL